MPSWLQPVTTKSCFSDGLNKQLMIYSTFMCTDIITMSRYSHSVLSFIWPYLCVYWKQLVLLFTKEYLEGNFKSFQCYRLSQPLRGWPKLWLIPNKHLKGQFSYWRVNKGVTRCLFELLISASSVLKVNGLRKKQQVYTRTCQVHPSLAALFHIL